MESEEDVDSVELCEEISPFVTRVGFGGGGGGLEFLVGEIPLFTEESFPAEEGGGGTGLPVVYIFYVKFTVNIFKIDEVITI